MYKIADSTECNKGFRLSSQEAQAFASIHNAVADELVELQEGKISDVSRFLTAMNHSSRI